MMLLILTTAAALLGPKDHPRPATHPAAARQAAAECRALRRAIRQASARLMAERSEGMGGAMGGTTHLAMSLAAMERDHREKGCASVPRATPRRATPVR